MLKQNGFYFLLNKSKINNNKYIKDSLCLFLLKLSKTRETLFFNTFFPQNFSLQLLNSSHRLCIFYSFFFCTQVSSTKRKIFLSFVFLFFILFFCHCFKSDNVTCVDGRKPQGQGLVVTLYKGLEK